MQNYVLRDYIDEELARSKEAADEAEAQAFAARQEAQASLEKASSAKLSSQEVDIELLKLIGEVNQLSEHLEEYKRDALDSLPKVRTDIEHARKLLDHYQTYADTIQQLRADSDQFRIDLVRATDTTLALKEEFERNNTRIGWRSKELPITSRDAIGKFDVDFAPDTPLPEKVTVLIRGVTLLRKEHGVSVLRAQVSDVRVEGTTVAGNYRCTLSDNDSNGPDEGGLSIDVFAQLLLRDK